MIINFEEYTYELNWKELEAVEYVSSILRNHVGKDNAISNGKIRNVLQENGYNFGGPRIRKIISYIRIKNIIHRVCSSHNGYFVAKDSEELNEYIKSLDGRINAMAAVKQSLLQQEGIYEKRGTA